VKGKGREVGEDFLWRAKSGTGDLSIRAPSSSSLDSKTYKHLYGTFVYFFAADIDRVR
jgi:hypothetical protein